MSFLKLVTETATPTAQVASPLGNTFLCSEGQFWVYCVLQKSLTQRPIYCALLSPQPKFQAWESEGEIGASFSLSTIARLASHGQLWVLLVLKPRFPRKKVEDQTIVPLDWNLRLPYGQSGVLMLVKQQANKRGSSLRLEGCRLSATWKWG